MQKLSLLIRTHTFFFFLLMHFYPVLRAIFCLSLILHALNYFPVCGVGAGEEEIDSLLLTEYRIL